MLEQLVVLILGILCTNGKESISCGETINGYRSAKQKIPLIFNATNDYSLVYLEGCQSTHDIWLEILDSNNNSIADADDNNDHGVELSECGNKWAGDITMPGHVKSGEQYTFMIKGYKNRHGYYSVTLVCQDEYQDKTTTTTTTSPTTTTTTSTTQDNDDSNCDQRIRKAWHLLNQEEKDLYINGWMELKRNGKLEIFTETHGDPNIAKHENAAFLPWHRFFIWELESQYRNLGGDWKCFGLPYWDWSYDIEVHGSNVEDYDILNSGLGSKGNPDNNYCVDNDGWDNYIPHESTGNNNDGVPCLRRKICGESGETKCSFPGQASQLHSILTNEEYYGDDDTDYDYRYRLELIHGSAHGRIGGSSKYGGRGHLGYLSKSTDDPIFYLIHSFVDFQYSLWQDCRDHELISKYGITTDMYNGDIYQLDDELDFGALENQQWSYLYNYNHVTVRDMHSIQDWNVMYDKGDYFYRAKVEDDASICQGKINPLWFINDTVTTETRRRLKGKYGSDNEEYSHDIFDKITKKYGCQKSSSTEEKSELFKTWAQMDCQWLNIGNNCVRPKYFDDCSDMEWERYVPGTGQYDLDITLDELIEKVEEYPCMVETREMYYEWAKEVGNLKGLARGDYDIFCDREFVSKQPAEAKCAANQDKKGRHKAKKKGSYKWYM